MPVASSAHHMSPKGSGLYTPEKKIQKVYMFAGIERESTCMKCVNPGLFNKHTEGPSYISVHFPVGMCVQQVI